MSHNWAAPRSIQSDLLPFFPFIFQNSCALLYPRTQISLDLYRSHVHDGKWVIVCMRREIPGIRKREGKIGYFWFAILTAWNIAPFNAEKWHKMLGNDNVRTRRAQNSESIFSESSSLGCS